MDAQYLDLIQKTGTAGRLGRSPCLVNDEVAIYGIDAVTKPAWHAEDFTLEAPPADAFTILCMHQLLQPPVPEFFAEHPLDDVLNRVNLDLDALALGDYHETVSTREQGVEAWYAGSTEQCAIDEDDPRTVSLIDIEDGEVTRREKELDTREFDTISIPFAEDDGYAYAENEIDRHVIDGRVVMVTLKGEPSTVTSRDVREIVMNRGAAVCRVDDQRGGPDIDTSDGPTGDIESADKLIEEKLAERNLSNHTVRIEERVRTEDVTPTGFDSEVKELVKEAQDEAFDKQSIAGGETEGAE